MKQHTYFLLLSLLFLQSHLPSEILHEEWQVWFRPHQDEAEIHLFTVKESSVLGAGYGLFAAQNLQPNRCIGLFHGEVLPSGVEPSFYAISDKQLGVTVDPMNGVVANSRAKPRAAYFALHMANDSSLSTMTTSASRTRSESSNIPDNNFFVGDCFWAYTKRAIQSGEELFMDYNRDGELMYSNKLSANI